MFIEHADLGATMYGYQISQITEDNMDIVDVAMAAAEEELRSYISGNNKIEWKDGRLRYDVEAILSATGTDRHPLLLRHGITITKWFVVDLCNADIIYEQAKERYDRSVEWLKQLASGAVNLSNLPTLSEEAIQNERDPFTYGSRKKFNHE